MQDLPVLWSVVDASKCPLAKLATNFLRGLTSPTMHVLFMRYIAGLTSNNYYIIALKMPHNKNRAIASITKIQQTTAFCSEQFSI